MCVVCFVGWCRCSWRPRWRFSAEGVVTGARGTVGMLLNHSALLVIHSRCSARPRWKLNNMINTLTGLTGPSP
jgi:hypothetical protein